MQKPLFAPAVPLYHQVAQALRVRLESQESGGRLGTEEALCREFGVSRTTVRQALGDLKREGLLQSRRGVGTHSVAQARRRRVVRASGDPLHAALRARPRVLSLGPVPAPPPVAQFFGIAAGEPVFQVLRVHTLDDGTRLSVVRSCIPAAVGRDISRADLRQPMHTLLWQRFGLKQHRSVHTLRVARAEMDVAALLGIALSEPVLRIQSSVYLPGGEPIRWTENFFREDLYEYRAEMEWPDPASPRHAGRAAASRRRK